VVKWTSEGIRGDCPGPTQGQWHGKGMSAVFICLLFDFCQTISQITDAAILNRHGPLFWGQKVKVMKHKKTCQRWSWCYF